MKLCLITDQHFGARGDHQAFLTYFDKFYSEVFFPYLEEHNITTILMLGDTFERRKYTNHATLYSAKNIYFDKLLGYDVHMLVGNHDVFYKNTNEVNTPDLVLKHYQNIKIYEKPQDVIFDGLRVALVPWICSGNHSETLEFLNTTTSQVMFGHLEIQGFEMHRGAFNDHGFVYDQFQKFDMVCSGHFHHKSSRSNIHYLGAPYEMTWSDWNDPRGFHIFDTDTRELSFIQNPFNMFHKIHYDDSSRTMDEIMDFDFQQLCGTFVKVIVRSKNNPYWYDLFIDKIEKAGAIGVQSVEDHFNLNLEDDEEIVNEAEDTLTILKKVAEQTESPVPKKQLINFLSILYQEALNSE